MPHDFVAGNGDDRLARDPVRAVDDGVPQLAVVDELGFIAADGDVEVGAALDEIVIEEYPELHISASIGGAFAAGRISRTIHRADLAMYQAKLKKDCVAIYREAKERET